MPASNEIYAGVTKVLVEALSVEEDDINPSATLQGDLGAESIDFLDIVFRLERRFGIKIPRGELFPEDVLGDGASLLRDGHLTDEGMVALRSRMPFAELRDLGPERRLSRIDDLITVDLLASYVTWKLGGGGKVETKAEPTIPDSAHASMQTKSDKIPRQPVSASKGAQEPWPV
jgi:acyl carrier protein